MPVQTPMPVPLALTPMQTQRPVQRRKLVLVLKAAPVVQKPGQTPMPMLALKLVPVLVVRKQALPQVLTPTRMPGQVASRPQRKMLTRARQAAPTPMQKQTPLLKPL